MSAKIVFFGVVNGVNFSHINLCGKDANGRKQSSNMVTIKININYKYKFIMSLLLFLHIFMGDKNIVCKTQNKKKI